MNYFSMLIKPASSLCNMRCRYCFYYDVASHRETASYGIMAEDTVDCLLSKTFASVKSPASVSFTFQGGEPTMAGLSYFTYFTEQAEKLVPAGIKLSYSIQTNGMVIDEDWCRLFVKYHFLVGLSLDGPRELHDYQRLGSDRKGTYDRVHHTLKLFRRFGVDFNILSVITKQTAKKPQTLFQFYLKQDFKFVQLIPCLRPLDSDLTAPHDLDPRSYAEFMKRFFGLWYEQLKNGRYISVRQFDNLVWMLRGRPAEQCGLMGYCTPQFVLEADGSVYPCDFYVLDEYKSGNIRTDDLEQIKNSPATRKFLACETEASPLCETCKVKSICGCGCKRYRPFYNEIKDYCPYQDFLYEVYPKLYEIAKTM